MRKGAADMDFPTLIAFCFLGSIFMFSRFSKYSRRLLRAWDMDPEEVSRCQARAKSALAAAGFLLAVCAIALILAVVLPPSLG